MQPTINETTTETDMDLTKNPVVTSTLIDCFLAGITNGRTVLQALYDDILDEPVPAQMLALVRGATCPAA